MASDPSPGRFRELLDRRRWLPWLVFGTIGLAALVAVTWWSYGIEVQRITATTFGSQVLDDTSVKVTFDVNRPPGLAVTCTVQALDRYFTVVGSTDIVVPPAGDRAVRLTGIVRTTTRAVAGQVHDCVRT